ncbi:hypothetical protein [Qipengyuania sp. ASV99]|uniref:hypothetical protein n=1 Tax=Qipengyuania sp. ASV99 TaxID=3399681 RepID=UPI003A4C6F8D
MRVTFAAFLALALASCGGAPEPADETVPSETPIPVEPDGGLGDGAGPPPADTPGMIPARYLGVWDYVGGTCSRDSDMRMEIAPRSITFYESFGQVAGVGQDGDDAVADLVMEGEGETWVNVLRLSLVEKGGQTLLHTSDGTAPKVADEYPRKKCS